MSRSFLIVFLIAAVNALSEVLAERGSTQSERVGATKGIARELRRATTRRAKTSFGGACPVGIAGWQDPRAGPTGFLPELALFENPHRRPLPGQFPGDRQANHTAADDDHVGRN